MEIFRTVVNCPSSPEKIDYQTALTMLGSCFAENLGLRMEQLKFNISLNPFGIVYHPAPIAHSIERIISAKPYTVDDLEHHDGYWSSFDHHGKFSRSEAPACLEIINNTLQEAHNQLACSQWLFVSFGTAWAYRLKSTGKTVANCHKFLASHFERIRFQVDEIYDIWEKTISALRKFNPAIKIVFTISPIRHLRDGAHENQLSKSTLLLAVERLINEQEGITYFPAYEIVLDELRDYRFYDADMTHISPVAINYIWRRFCETYIADSAFPIMKKVEAEVKAAAHRKLKN